MEAYPENWTAMWITESWQRDAYPLLGEHLAFRRDYDIRSRPLSARIAITASIRYFLWINGTFVASGPARCYPQRQCYDVVDITSTLVAGSNAFAVVVQKPSGITGYSLINRMGLLAHGEIVCAEGSTPIGTDSSWKVRNAAWYTGTPYTCSTPLGFQEHVRGADEPDEWKTAEPLGGWAAAFCLGGAGTPPWKLLEPGRTQRSLETPCTPQPCWRGKTGREMPDVRYTNLAQTFEAQPVIGARCTREELSDSLDSTEDNVYVFDFDKTRYVRPGVEIVSQSGDVRLEFYYDLSLQERPHTMMGFGHDSEGFCDSFAPSARSTSWMGLTPRGCRFLTVKIAGAGDCRFRLRTTTVDYPYAQDNQFACSDAFLQRVWDTSAETLRSATTDVIGEPVRENVLWTFDGCVGGKAAFYTFGDTAMWRHCLELIGQGIDEDGIPNAVVPSGYSFMVLIDQALFWAHSCREYYWATGDDAFLARQLPAAGRLLSFCRRHLTHDGLFIPPGYAWHWVDWAALNKEPYSMPINGLLLLAAQAVQAMTQHSSSGFGSVRALSDELVAQLGLALMSFYDQEENCFRSHVPADTVRPVSSINHSTPVAFDLHSNALACLTKLGTAQQRAGAAAKMLQLLEGAKHTVTSIADQPFGIGWSQLVLEPLFEQGFVEQGMHILRRYYGRFLEMNAATWGEDFVPTDHNTAHGWGSCVNSLIVESLCGIRPLEPGWSRIGLSPRLPQGMTMHCRIKVPPGDIQLRSDTSGLALLAPEGLNVVTDQTTCIAKREWMRL